MFTPASRLVTTAVWILCKSSEASRVISVVCSWMIFGTISSTSGAMYWPPIWWVVHFSRMKASLRPAFRIASTWAAVVDLIIPVQNQCEICLMVLPIPRRMSVMALTALFPKPFRAVKGLASWAVVTTPVNPWYPLSLKSHNTKFINSMFDEFISFVISLAYRALIPRFASTARRQRLRARDPHHYPGRRFIKLAHGTHRHIHRRGRSARPRPD